MKIASQALAIVLILFFGIYVSAQFALYEVFPYLDSLMHFIGGVVLGWIGVTNLKNPTLRRTLLFVLVLGVIWEIAEYSSGRLFAPGSLVYKYFSGGDRLDTIIDVILDLAGAALAHAALFKPLHTFKRFDAQE